jgi:hypothetical protein
MVMGRKSPVPLLSSEPSLAGVDESFAPLIKHGGDGGDGGDGSSTYTRNYTAIFLRVT